MLEKGLRLLIQKLTLVKSIVAAQIERIININFYIICMEVSRPIILISVILLASAQSSQSSINNITPSQQVKLQQGKGIVRSLHNNQSVTIQYTEEEGSTDLESIYLRVNFIGLDEVSARFSVNASIQSKGEELIGLSALSQHQTRESFTAEFPLRKGTYSIRLSTDDNVRVSIILTKQYLNHVKFSGNEILSKAGVSEFYSEMPEIVEIFKCQGDIRVTLGSSYEDLFSLRENSSATTLEEANYGGHFLIDTKKGSGEYFIKVEGKEGQANISYLINHNPYTPGTILSSAITSFLRKLTYRITLTELIFSLSTVTIAESAFAIPESTLVVYQVYIGESKEKISRFINCKVGFPLSHNKAEIFIDGNAITSIPLHEIPQIVGNSDVFYIAAEAKVYVEPISKLDYNDFPHQLRLTYQTIQLSQTKMRQQWCYYILKILIGCILVGFAMYILYYVVKQSKYRKQCQRIPNHSNQSQNVNQNTVIS